MLKKRPPGALAGGPQNFGYDLRHLPSSNKPYLALRYDARYLPTLYVLRTAVALRLTPDTFVSFTGRYVWYDFRYAPPSLGYFRTRSVGIPDSQVPAWIFRTWYVRVSYFM